MFENPTVPVGVISRLVGGAMNLARPIKYFVQIRWTIFISFEWLLPLIGFRATKSSVDRCVFNFFIVVSALMFVASWPAIAIHGFRGARVTGTVASMSQPAVFSRTKMGRKCGEGCHELWLFLAEVSSKPLVSDAMFEGRKGFCVRTIDDLIFPS